MASIVVAPVFLILCSIMGAGNVSGDRISNAFKVIPCEDWKCVENVIDKAKDSAHVSRIRVFNGKDANWNSISKAPLFDPVLDLWFH